MDIKKACVGIKAATQAFYFQRISEVRKNMIKNLNGSSAEDAEDAGESLSALCVISV